MEAEILKTVLTGKGHSMQNILSMSDEIFEMLNRKYPKTYDDFVSQIDIDLENIISDSESGRNFHHNKSEDEMTVHLLSQIKRLYPSAHHDPHNGGHVDIYFEVKSSDGVMFKWIAEAKKWDGATWGDKGLFYQLLTSYTNGGENKDRGGIIFYSQIPSGGAFVMKEWKKHIEEKGIDVLDLRNDELRFSTKHILNNGNGPNFHVRHYCVDVYHPPTQANTERKATRQRVTKSKD
ncbi:hypothetical protein AB4186_01695 [Vibrio lentus]